MKLGTIGFRQQKEQGVRVTVNGNKTIDILITNIEKDNGLNVTFKIIG